MSTQPRDTAVPMRFEVTTLPVADVDRAKAFYQRLGWRLDIDFKPDPESRGVQFTPPGSPASIHFGDGTTAPPPGSTPLQRLILAVEDIQAARDELVERGVAVGEIFHTDPGRGAAPGVHPERRSYGSLAPFTDPDGNGWLLQEVTERLPGRVDAMDVDARAQLLRETAEHHDAFEKAAPPHDWADWYAAYLDARERGSSPDEAASAAEAYMAQVKDVVLPHA